MRMTAMRKHDPYLTDASSYDEDGVSDGHTLDERFFVAGNPWVCKGIANLTARRGCCRDSSSHSVQMRISMS